MRSGFLAGALALLALAAASPGATGLVAVRCDVVDASNGALIPARCRVIDAYGKNRFPPLLGSFYHTGHGGYFYTSGSFTVSVPAGRIVLHTGRGFEYGERIDTLSATADTSVIVRLERAISMADEGWFSGDAHMHINHFGGYYVLDPEDAILMGRAEGLNVVNCLDNDYFFTGMPAACSAADCIVFMSQEIRSSSYGHLGFLGMASLVHPFSSIWWPLAMNQIDSCHARPGAIAVTAHPVTSWNFDEIETWSGSGLARELPVDIIGGRVDAFDLMSYSNIATDGIELDLWYRLLDCGFRLPASAGTDATMNSLGSPPLGGYRVFVRMPEDGLDFHAWLAGLAAGRTFVSNGPLITRFAMDGREPGDSASVAIPGGTLQGEISLRGVRPVDRVEIVMNGEVVLAIDIDPARSSFDTTFAVTVLESAWIAARVSGPRSGWIPVGSRFFAHTSPVYFTMRGERVVDREDAQYFVEWISALEALVLEKGQWSDPQHEVRVLSEFALARAFYEGLADPAAAAGEGERKMPRPPANSPNPFASATTIEFEVAGPDAPGADGRRTRIAIFDVSGRLVRRLLDEPRAPGRHRVVWDGRDDRGAAIASGVYFARIAAEGAASARKMILLR